MDNGPKRVAPRRSNPLSKPATDVVEFQRDSIPRISGFTITRVFHVHSSHWIGTDFSFGCFGVALISRGAGRDFLKFQGLFVPVANSKRLAANHHVEPKV